MNYKIILKRVNRGVVLGILALIVLVVYIVVDNIRFRNYKDGIIKVLKQYTDECELAYIIDNDTDLEKGFLSEKAKDRIEEKYKNIIDKYWIDAKKGVAKNTGIDKTQMLDNKIKAGKYYSDSTKKTKGFIKDAHFTIEEVDTDEFFKSGSLKKVGPNIVEITVILKGEYEFIGVPYNICFSPVNANMSSDIEYEYLTVFYDGKSLNNKEKNFVEDMKSNNIEKLKEAKASFKESVVFYLSRENGEWKIIEACTEGVSSLKGDGELIIKNNSKSEDKENEKNNNATSKKDK